MRAAGVLTVTRVVAGAVCSLLLGAVIALGGAFQHQRDVDLLGATVPAGLLLGLLAVVLGQGVAAVIAGRLGVVLLSLAWLVSTTVLGTSRAEGDLVVAGDGRGTAYLWLGLLTCLVGGFRWSLHALGRAARLRDR